MGARASLASDRTRRPHRIWLAAPIATLVTCLLMAVPSVAATPQPLAVSARGPGALVAPVTMSNFTGHNEWALYFDSAAGRMYGAEEGVAPARIAVFNGSTHALITKVAAGPNSMGYLTEPLGADSAASKIFVQETGASGNGELGQFSTVTDRDLPSHAYLNGCAVAGPAFDPVNGFVYASCGKATVTGPVVVDVINSSTLQVVTNITLGTGAGYAAWGPGVDLTNGAVYQAWNDKTELSVINATTNTIERNITGLPRDMETPLYNPTNGYMYVPSLFGTIPVINPASNTVVLTIDLEYAILQAILIPSLNEVAALIQPTSCTMGCSSSLVSYVNATTGLVIGNQTVPFGSAALAYDTITNRVWVSDPGGVGAIYFLKPVI
jgi:hypothetical protein